MIINGPAFRGESKITQINAPGKELPAKFKAVFYSFRYNKKNEFISASILILSGKKGCKT
jgi:hypothetical protein